MRADFLVPAEPASRAEARLNLFDRFLSDRLQRRLRPGRIGLELWDGSSPPGQPGAPVGQLVVRDRRALAGLVLNPDLYFGEVYMSGRVQVRGDFFGVIEGLSRLSTPTGPSPRERIALWTSRAADLGAARRNIQHHYDLGNDFYDLWLDSQLVYTCAYYPTAGATLEEAQVAKLDLVCRKLALRPGDRVIEAGCGWGALALHMARHYGATVRAFNISTEQIQFARERAAREGLTDRVEFIDEDYRNVAGRCDVFVSVGMLEHVGRSNFDALSAVIRRTLDRNTGRGLLHFIGRDRPRPLNAWIRRRIFPGAYPPSLTEVSQYVLEPADLSVVDVENLRPHYARTLADWRHRFEAAESHVSVQFGDAFYRAWRLYLAGSQAAFSTGWMQLFQIVFQPSGAPLLRWTRDGLYSD
ncbi:MAG TPA: cyclopropane-fatty-acyl-phospholipid synthase family protein [Vicinamibacterales bacterium]|nr:cyclopropane-fatty-acyl-phospholipid synthase family protein [Vicinamibacterales bacterium]